MEKEFVRAHSLRDITVSVVLLVAGIALIVMPKSIPVNIVGTCLAIPGLLLLLFLRTDYKDPETNLRFRRKIKYYPASKKNEILAALKSEPAKYSWVEDSYSDGVMIDVYAGKNVDKVFAHVSEFIPYSYVPCSEWFTFDHKSAGELAK